MKTLIVIDMQNDFISGPLGTPEAQVIVPNVVNKVRMWLKSDVLYFTRDTHTFNYKNTLEGKMLPIQHCIKDSGGWCIIDELLPYTHGSVINKETFGWENWRAFHGLDECDEIHICGVCTDICVISNALALRMFYPNKNITVDASCCAGTTPENHKAALQVMKCCQINVIGE